MHTVSPATGSRVSSDTEGLQEESFKSRSYRSKVSEEKLHAPLFQITYFPSKLNDQYYYGCLKTTNSSSRDKRLLDVKNKSKCSEQRFFCNFSSRICISSSLKTLSSLHGRSRRKRNRISMEDKLYSNSINTKLPVV